MRAFAVVHDALRFVIFLLTVVGFFGMLVMRCEIYRRQRRRGEPPHAIQGDWWILGCGTLIMIDVTLWWLWP